MGIQVQPNCCGPNLFATVLNSDYETYNLHLSKRKYLPAYNENQFSNYEWSVPIRRAYPSVFLGVDSINGRVISNARNPSPNVLTISSFDWTDGSFVADLYTSPTSTCVCARVSGEAGKIWVFESWSNPPTAYGFYLKQMNLDGSGVTTLNTWTTPWVFSSPHTIYRFDFSRAAYNHSLGLLYYVTPRLVGETVPLGTRYTQYYDFSSFDVRGGGGETILVPGVASAIVVDPSGVDYSSTGYPVVCDFIPASGEVVFLTPGFYGSPALSPQSITEKLWRWDGLSATAFVTDYYALPRTVVSIFNCTPRDDDSRKIYLTSAMWQGNGGQWNTTKIHDLDIDTGVVGDSYGFVGAGGGNIPFQGWDGIRTSSLGYS